MEAQFTDRSCLPEFGVFSSRKAYPGNLKDGAWGGFQDHRSRNKEDERVESGSAAASVVAVATINMTLEWARKIRRRLWRGNLGKAVVRGVYVRHDCAL